MSVKAAANLFHTSDQVTVVGTTDHLPGVILVGHLDHHFLTSYVILMS
jgi:hypothetical protein